MRQRKLITRTLLILFIVNQVVDFAFGAPVAVREKLEGCIDADVTEDGTATLQKRVNPVEEGSTNMAGQTPPSPDRTEVDQLWQGEEDMLIDSPTPLHIPMYPPPLTPPPPLSPPPPMSPAPLTPPPPLSPPPLTPPPPPTSPPPLTPPPPPTTPPPLPEEHLPQAWPLTTKTTSHQPTQQQSLGPDLDVHPPNPEPRPPAAAEIPIGDFLDMLIKGKVKRYVSASGAVNSARMGPRLRNDPQW
ncbi:hypothetical protein F5888DRAFT_1741418 [Russula emetica]|nr:hypothetical protein F5888DRAFT_1741418 [Russula emetica]